MHGIKHVFRQIALRGIEQRLAVLCNKLAALYNVFCIEIFKIVHRNQIGKIEGRNCPAPIKLVALRSV